MALTAVNAISAMVAPVVLLTVGGLVTNGLLQLYASINDRMREMTSEELDILTGPDGEELDRESLPAMARQRLSVIDTQLPMLLRRHHLTRYAVLTIYIAIAVLGLSVIAIAVAVDDDSEIIARVALGLVLGGTVVLISGLGIAARSLAKSADAIGYAVRRTRQLG